MVIASGRPIAHVAKELELSPQLLGRWVHDYRVEHPDPGGPSPAESARIRELEEKNRVLQMENESLKTGPAAFFAKTLQP